ncbi:MAG: hypothetical protein P8M04_08945 [Akkermansiaceae bacterium]|jgi:hypothetical protein|nr:hypothetical protein [Akkermansiaceae bacterium]
MRKILTLLVASASLTSATTLEVLRVFQPLSLHGTDVDHEFKGEAIQAHIFARPMVLSGAMPENLVLAVATPHRMPATFNYDVNECNLLTLFQVELSGIMLDSGQLKVAFNLSKMKAPEGVELPIRTVLKLSIQALKRTLEDYHHPENKPLKVKIAIEGTTEKNRSLRDLGGGFVVTG